MPRKLLVVAIALLALIGGAGPASAHDELLSTDPVDGSTIAAVPDRLTLTFNLPTLNIGTAIRVTGPDGDVATGDAVLVDDTVSQPLRADAPAGAYQVLWRVTSADGHPISGSFSFTARAGGSGQAGGTEAATPAGTQPGAPSTGTQAAGTQAAGDASDAPSPLIWVGLGVIVLLVSAGVLLAIRRRPAE